MLPAADDGPWPDPGPGMVRAGGGVVIRPGPDGGPREVLLVHRPRYDDWSFPKGKCDAGEGFQDAARREVAEETGFACELGAPLAELRYSDQKGRPKVVRYWAMTVTAGSFAPNDEVDQIAWLPFAEARDRLSYPHDADLLDAVDAA